MEEKVEKRYMGKISVPGTDESYEGFQLIVSDEQIILEGAMTFKGQNHTVVPVILGAFNQLNAITFVDCQIRSFTMGSGGYHVRIYVSYFIQNVHLTVDQLKFRSMEFSCMALCNWLINDKFIEASDDDRTFNVPIDKTIVNVPIDAGHITVDFGYSKRFNLTELHVKQNCWVTISFPDGENINVFNRIMRRLKRLLLFLLNANPEFDSIHVSEEQNDLLIVTSVKDNLRTFPASIEVDYHSAGDRLNDIVHRWFTIKDLEPVADSILIQILNSEISTQSLFLNTCIAWESFHQKFGGEAAISQTKIANRAKIIELIKEDNELASWFKNESSNWKYPSLRERILIFASLIGIIKGNFLTATVDEFVKKVVRTRNDIAHKGEYLSQFNIIELAVAARILDVCIRIEILKLLGVDTKMIEDRATKQIKWLAFANKLKEIN